MGVGMAMELLGQPSGMKQIAACAFGRGLVQIWLSQHGLKQRFNHPSACAPRTVVVKRVAGVGLAPMIEQGVAWPTIKTQHIAIGMQHTEVGNATHIQHAHCAVGLAKNALVKHGHKRCALTTSRHIAAAEIGDHIDACEFGQ